MAGKIQRMRTTFENGRQKTGLLINGAEIMYVEDFVQNMALNVAESYIVIDKGEKSREETDIDLQMEVLNSLSNALKSLGTVLYY